jgi:gamma-glutamylcyclotransferase (GGCT)/AIG2-like uncharacterized protein YtfP
MNKNTTPERTHLFFFYGTLKKGQCRNGVLSEQEYIGPAKTKPNYLMYNCGSFPALVEVAEGEGKEIEGELWRVKDSLIPVLDRIEGAPWLYKLNNVRTDVEGEVKTYLYQQDTSRLRECGVLWK